MAKTSKITLRRIFVVNHYGRKYAFVDKVTSASQAFNIAKNLYKEFLGIHPELAGQVDYGWEILDGQLDAIK